MVRKVILAVDGSEQAIAAFNCKYPYTSTCVIKCRQTTTTANNNYSLPGILYKPTAGTSGVNSVRV